MVHRIGAWHMVGAGFVVAAVLILDAGCATTGYQRSEGIADTMAKQTQVIQEAKPQVDAMLASLNDLTRTPGDLRPAFKKFSDTLNDTEKLAARVRKTGETIREKESTYFAEWEKQATEIQNPQIKAATQARQAEVKAKLASLGQTGRTAGAAYDPFIANMKDVRNYLSNDLTPGGISKIEPTIEKARRDGAALQKALDDFNRASEGIQASLRPAGQ